MLVDIRICTGSDSTCSKGMAGCGLRSSGDGNRDGRLIGSCSSVEIQVIYDKPDCTALVGIFLPQLRIMKSQPQVTE